MVGKQLEPLWGKSPGGRERRKSQSATDTSRWNLQWLTRHNERLSSGAPASGLSEGCLPATAEAAAERLFIFKPGNTLTSTHFLLWRKVAAALGWFWFLKPLIVSSPSFLWTLLIPEWFSSSSSLVGNKMPHFQHPYSPSTTTSLSLNGAEAVKHGGRRRRPWGTLGCITVCRKRQFIRRYCLCAGPESPRHHPRPFTSYRLQLLASDWLAVVVVGRGPLTDPWSAAINLGWGPGAAVDTARRGSNERLTRAPLEAPAAKHFRLCQSSCRSSLPYLSSSSSSTSFRTVEAP